MTTSAKPATLKNLRTATDYMADATNEQHADSVIAEWIRDAATPDDVRNAEPLVDLRGVGETLSLEILAKLGMFLEETSR